jgi:hypothetical protein
MSNHAYRARTGQDRASLYGEITDEIIAELEAGCAPWVQPWSTAAAKAPLALPKDASTARRHVALYRVMAAAQLPRNPLNTHPRPSGATSPARHPASSSPAPVDHSTTSIP